MSEPESVLLHRGPLLSSALIRELVQTGLSGVSARQRIRRALLPPKPRIYRLARLSFPHNQKLLYLGQQFRTPRYWSSLVNAMIESGSVYGIALASLQLRGGMT